MSWVGAHSFLQGHRSKWVFRSSIVWPHLHRERWAIIGCGKPRQVCNVVKKWVNDKQNVGVVGRVNNQEPILGPTHEQRRAQAISKGMSTRGEANSYSCKWSAKEVCN